jgi:hypothetical protein
VIELSALRPESDFLGAVILSPLHGSKDQLLESHEPGRLLIGAVGALTLIRKKDFVLAHAQPSASTPTRSRAAAAG